jgi:hypothetical protein
MGCERSREKKREERITIQKYKNVNAGRDCVDERGNKGQNQQPEKNGKRQTPEPRHVMQDGDLDSARHLS